MKHKRSHSPVSDYTLGVQMAPVENEDLTTILDCYRDLIDTLEDESDVDDACRGGTGGWVANDAMRYLRGQDKGIAALKRLGWRKDQ